MILAEARDGRELVEPRIGHGDAADVRLDGAERIVGRLRRLGGGERIEQGRLADIGQADDSTVETHSYAFDSSARWFWRRREMRHAAHIAFVGLGATFGQQRRLRRPARPAPWAASRPWDRARRARSRAAPSAAPGPCGRDGRCRCAPGDSPCRHGRRCRAARCGRRRRRPSSCGCGRAPGRARRGTPRRGRAGSSGSARLRPRPCSNSFMKVMGFRISVRSPPRWPSATSPLKRARHGEKTRRRTISSTAMNPTLCRCPA